MFFVDKCLPFGASISCALFQEFLDSLAYLAEYMINRNSKKVLTNYLDDFLFMALLRKHCNDMLSKFTQLCQMINCPMSLDKTEFASITLVFLGVLMDGEHHCLVILQDKKQKAMKMLQTVIDKKKMTIKEVQQLTGFLNFLNRSMVPGRAFTRRMYSSLKTTDAQGRKLKQHHHININGEFKEDCRMWIEFLETSDDNRQQLCRPFLDLHMFETSRELDFSSDASGKIGFGCYFNGNWTFGFWNKRFLEFKPSIEYLELFALCVAVFTWTDKIKNMRIIIFCDNQSVVDMINSSSSNCKNCMVLIRKLTLNNLRYNRRILVKHVRSEDNYLSDSLSRGQFE